MRKIQWIGSSSRDRKTIFQDKESYSPKKRFTSSSDTSNQALKSSTLSSQHSSTQEEEKERTDSTHVFTTNKESIHITRKRISMAIEKFQKDYPNQKRWRCHDLRHSYAFNFLKNGGNMYQLQAILGHKSITMTIDLYGQLSALDVGEVVVY